MKHVPSILSVVSVLMIAGTGSAAASGLSTSQQVQAFATCAGRMQALATRQSALHDPASHATRALQGDFEMLLEATLPTVEESTLPHGAARRWQASGWVEIAALLRRTQGNRDDARAARAEAAMAQRITTCTRMIMRS